MSLRRMALKKARRVAKRRGASRGRRLGTLSATSTRNISRYLFAKYQPKDADDAAIDAIFAGLTRSESRRAAALRQRAEHLRVYGPG